MARGECEEGRESLIDFELKQLRGDAIEPAEPPTLVSADMAREAERKQWEVAAAAASRSGGEGGGGRSASEKRLHHELSEETEQVTRYTGDIGRYRGGAAAPRALGVDRAGELILTLTLTLTLSLTLTLTLSLTLTLTSPSHLHPHAHAHAHPHPHPHPHPVQGRSSALDQKRKRQRALRSGER